MDIGEQLQKRVEIVSKKFKINNLHLLGSGGEGCIYDYNGDALKVYLHNPEEGYLSDLQKLQIELAKHKFTFSTPQIYEIGEVDGVSYTIEKRLKGVQMDYKLKELDRPKRQLLFRSYYEAIKQVNSLSFPNLPFGNIIKTGESINSDNWTDFLIKSVKYKIDKTPNKTKVCISRFDQKLEMFNKLTRKYLNSNEKRLVHCDYYQNNVLVDDNLSISAVLDFGVHTAIGDPRLDISSVIKWNTINPDVQTENYIFLLDIAKKDFGDDLGDIADLYLLYSSFYFLDMEDPSFSIKNLNNDKLWQKYTQSTAL